MNALAFLLSLLAGFVLGYTWAARRMARHHDDRMLRRLRRIGDQLTRNL